MVAEVPCVGVELVRIRRTRDSDPPGGGSPLPSNTSASGIDVSTSRIAAISTFPTVSVAAGIEEPYPGAHTLLAALVGMLRESERDA